MHDQLKYLRLVILVLVSAAAGWAAHNISPVHAAESSNAPAFFQMQGTGAEAHLLIYDSNTRTISVYQGVGSGLDTRPCSYQYVLERAGGTIHRRVCQVGSQP